MPLISRVPSGSLAVGLNLIWPGIGQIQQRRYLRGAAYFLSTTGLFVLLVNMPQSAVVALALLAVTAGSLVDAARLGPVRS